MARKGVTPLTGPRGRTLLEDISLKPFTPLPLYKYTRCKDPKEQLARKNGTPWRAWEILGMSLASLDIVATYTMKVEQDGTTVPWVMTQ